MYYWYADLYVFKIYLCKDFTKDIDLDCQWYAAEGNMTPLLRQRQQAGPFPTTRP